jgi:hypothetical protein
MSSERRLVGLSAMVVAGILSIAEIEKNDRLPTTRQWIALAAAYLLMALAVDLRIAGLGSALALLLMVSTLLVRGDDVLGYLGVRLGAVQSKKAKP